MKKLIAFTLAALLLVSAISAFASSTEGIKLGLGHLVKIDKSTSATADAAGAVQLDAMFCAAAFDANGTILSARFDTAQTNVGFDATGALQGDLTAIQPTKRDLGDAYGMKAASSIGMDWYEQMNGFESWLVGKNVSDVVNMPQTDGKASGADLTSTVTVHIGDFLTLIQNAYDDAMSR